MKFFGHSLLVAALCAALLASCAKEESESYSKYEKMALAAWMRLNRPDLVDNLQEDGGYYVDVLNVGNKDAAPINDTICWVKFDFSGRDLSGNIILTRREIDAKLAGTFTKYTHYVPYYRYCGDINTSLIEGTRLAMRNTLTLGEDYYNKYKGERGFESREILLREGSEVVLYMPSSVVGGVEGDGGYEGQYTLDSDRPFIVTMTICDTVKNPLESEGSTVDAFCEADGGLRVYDTEENKRPESADDADHPYNIAERWVNACDTVPQVYVDYRYKPGDAIHYPEPYQSAYEPYVAFDKMEQDIAEALKERFASEDGTYPDVKELTDSVKLDGTAKIWYICRFLDGFVVDTNIDEVKKIIYGEVASSGSAKEYTPEEGGTISAWYYTIPNLKFGQWAAMVTTSTNAYGSSGVSGSSSSSTSSSGYSSSYLDYLNYLNYANSYYGMNGYYGGYYGSYYGSYYGGYYDYYGYGSDYDDSSTTTTTTTVTTEIPPFTPLLFQIYVEPSDETDE